MKLQQLRYIIAVDRHKQFSKAAEELDLSQATLSSMIGKLEKELGVMIFDRKTQPLVTTDCGQELIMAARRILSEADNFYDLARNVKQKVAGQLRLGIIPTISSSLLPIFLRPFLGKYPEVELEIIEAPTASLTEQLKRGELDLAILSTPLKDNSIEDWVLYYELLLVYGSAEEQIKRYTTPDILLERPLWLLEEGNCLREQMLDLCQLRQKENPWPNLKLGINSFDCLLPLVDQMGGLTLVPELYLQQLSEERQQRLAYFERPVPVREISLAFYRPYAKLRLMEVLHKEIKELVKPLLKSQQYKNNEMRITMPE
ncbi:LysR substrate-binding domain-containing protein [Saprospira sp. CCB-QB6]|uniref:LysR family transcriptional regulator n=1 Tax=Saprospira sp. CCB-QB6 TaxID=3023936 RepID=UPI00234A42EF|nr:LysR substrate-binding domain-containing protein [Saprospira sp. CCB-QB6]WCL81191.1 LysR substrate-binding domain-containing protein [Saprospira sp. CCB-QB6]